MYFSNVYSKAAISKSSITVLVYLHSILPPTYQTKKKCVSLLKRTVTGWSGIQNYVWMNKVFSSAVLISSLQYSKSLNCLWLIYSIHTAPSYDQFIPFILHHHMIHLFHPYRTTIRSICSIHTAPPYDQKLLAHPSLCMVCLLGSYPGLHLDH